DLHRSCCPRPQTGLEAHSLVTPMRCDWIRPLEVGRVWHGLGIARKTLSGERVEIGLPNLALGLAQLVEIGPGVDAGVVPVIEEDADRVVAHRLDGVDGNMAFAGDRDPGIAAMALDLGGGAFDPEEFRREAEPRPVLERHLQDFLGPDETDFAGPGR